MAKAPAKTAKTTKKAAPKRTTRHRLSEEARQHIVVALACYQGPHAIVREIDELFGEQATAQTVCYYNPELRVGRNAPAQKYVDLFNAARKQFLEDAAQRPLAHQAYRLSVLEQTIEVGLRDVHADNARYEAAEHVRKAIETAAKEVGGVFTNVKKGSIELTGSVAITADEKRNVLADKMREIIEGRFTEIKPARATKKGK